jgi:hypothetical protein
MLYLKLLVFTAVFAFSGQSFASLIFIPEVMPGTPEYNNVRDLLKNAAGDSDGPLWNYQKASFYTVKTESGIYADPYKDHASAIVLQVNGKYFWMPTKLHHTDNWNTFARRQGERAGIYLIDRGHRWSPDRKTLYRVVAEIRMAKLDGTVLPSIEYSETLTVEPCPECIK